MCSRDLTGPPVYIQRPWGILQLCQSLLESIEALCFAGGFWRWPSSPQTLSSASKPILPELHEQHFGIFGTHLPDMSKSHKVIKIHKA